MLSGCERGRKCFRKPLREHRAWAGCGRKRGGATESPCPLWAGGQVVGVECTLTMRQAKWWVESLLGDLLSADLGRFLGKDRT